MTHGNGERGRVSRTSSTQSSLSSTVVWSIGFDAGRVVQFRCVLRPHLRFDRFRIGNWPSLCHPNVLAGFPSGFHGHARRSIQS